MTDTRKYQPKLTAKQIIELMRKVKKTIPVTSGVEAMAQFTVGSQAGGTQQGTEGSWGNIQQIVTVSSAVGADYTTIQAAIDSITDAAANKRYCIFVFPGRYNETLSLTSFINIIGVCDCRESVEIYSATGPIVQFPNDNTNIACLANLWLHLSPTTDNQKIVHIPDCSKIEIVHCKLEVDSLTNDVAATMIDQDGGRLHCIEDFFYYEMTGTAVGGKGHYGLYCRRDYLQVQDCQFAMFVGDDDDLLVAIDEIAAGTMATDIKDNTFDLTLTSLGGTGTVYGYNGSAAGTDKLIQNNRMNLTSGSAVGTNGIAVRCNSTAGTSLIRSIANHYKVTGFATNYWATFAAGDTCYSHFDQIEAATGHAGAGNYEFVNSPTPGETRVTGDITPDADGVYDLGSNSNERWEQIWGETVEGYVKVGEAGPAIRGRVYENANAGVFTSYLVAGADGMPGVTFIAHAPGSATKRRLLKLSHNANYSDNDADAIRYERNVTELFQVGNQGWLGDLYYNGVATVVPAMPPAADSVGIVFGAALPDAYYSVTLGGHTSLASDAGANIFQVYQLSSVENKGVNGFWIWPTWHVYDTATALWVGSWNNFTAMIMALGLIVLPMVALDVDWQVRRYL